MYTSFTIQNYRCFANIAIEPLERVNLIAGENNVGKTALLEALWIHHGYYNPELGFRVNRFRGLDLFKPDEFLWDLFSEFDPAKVIQLTSQDEEGKSRLLRITIQEQPTSQVSLRNEKQNGDNGRDFVAADTGEQETTETGKPQVFLEYVGPAQEKLQAQAVVEQDALHFQRPPGIKEPSGIFLVARSRDSLGALAERFSNLAVDKKETKIVDVLRIIEPRLQSLTLQQRGGASIIYGDIGLGRLMPLPLLGDGLGRLLGIALAIPEAQDGILLVDEIENGLHYTVMSKVWTALAELAREYNVQLFATTHSHECIVAAHQAFESSDLYDFRLHRLEREDDTIKAITYDQETLATSVEMELEVR